MKLIIVAVLTLFFSNNIIARQVDNCNASTELKKISAWVDNIYTYEVDIDVVVADSDVIITSKITGITAKRMKVRLTTQTDKYTATQSVWFDGKSQWVESKSPMGTQVVKLDANKLTKPDRPFDTSFYLMGVGLINGEDFPATLKVIFNIYDFIVECKPSGSLILVGNINKDKFVKYIGQSLYAKIKRQSVDKFIKIFSVAKLEFDLKSRGLKKYSFGDTNKPQMTYVVRKSHINLPLKYSDFNYHSPVGVEVEDITQKVQLQ